MKKTTKNQRGNNEKAGDVVFFEEIHLFSIQSSVLRQAQDDYAEFY